VVKELGGDHGGELLGNPDAHVDGNHIRQQPGKGRVVEPGWQHVLRPLPHCPGQCGLAFEPRPVRAAYSAATNTTTVVACSRYMAGSSVRYLPHSSICSLAS
jgi:hypothetical protein